MIDFARKIKAVDPTALVVGPEEWGWSGYFYSGYDQQYGSTHGWSSCPIAQPRRHGLPAVAARQLRQSRPTSVSVCSTSSPFTTIRRAASSATTCRARCSCAAIARRARCGIRLHRRDLDQRSRSADSAAEELGEHLLPGHADRHHRIQLGRREPHQRRDHAGGHLRHLRPRRAGHGRALDHAGVEHADLQGDEDVSQLRRQQVDVRRHERRRDVPNPDNVVGVRRRSDPPMAR